MELRIQGIFYNFQSQVALNGYRNAVGIDWVQLSYTNGKATGYKILPDYFQGWKVDGVGSIDIHITSELLISRLEETHEKRYDDTTKTTFNYIAYNPSEKTVQHYYGGGGIQWYSYTYTNNHMYGNSDVEALPCLRKMLEYISSPSIIRSTQRDYENSMAEWERREKRKKRHVQFTAILLGLSYLTLPLPFFYIVSLFTGTESVFQVLVFAGIAFSSFAAFLYFFR